MPYNIEIKKVPWENHKYEISAIRRAVFIEEQGVTEQEEWDGLDENADTLHLLAYLNGKPRGTARVLANGQLGRFSVLMPFRHYGLGAKLIQEAINHALMHNIQSLFLYAQLHVIQLYEKFGFQTVGKPFLDAGITHKKMVLNMASQDDLSKVYKDDAIFSTIEALNLHLRQMTQHAARNLKVMTSQLSLQLYSDERFLEYLSQLARQSRFSEIQILVQDTSSLVGIRHPIIELSQRLPSKLQIKKCLEPPQKRQHAYWVFDQKHLIYFNDEKNSQGFANYNAESSAKNLLHDFEYIWQSQSSFDENFYLLSI